MKKINQADTGRHQRVGVFAFVAAVAIVVALFCSATETPSGDGVPTPADWARHGQVEQTGP